MFKKLFASLLTSFLLAPSAFGAVTFELDQLKAVIDANDFVEVEKNIIFDASNSALPESNFRTSYEWKLGDGNAKFGEEVVHSYAQPGEYEVTLTIRQGAEVFEATQEVFAYEKLIVFLTDATEEQERIEGFVQRAREENTYIDVIESYDSTTAFLSEETLANKLADRVEILNNAASIVVWTTRGSGINALTRLVKEREEIKELLAEETIVVISDKGLNTLSRIVQSNYNITKPKQIVMTRQYELNNLVTSESIDDFIANLDNGITEYEIINDSTGTIKPWNSISWLVNFMITSGIPSNTIVLLLMLPVIATIIAFLKQVVGITTFGVYTPSIITLSFLALGLKFGLSILIVIILSGAIVRKGLERFRLLHIPRIAIILTITTLILLLLLAFGTYINISQIASIAVFPMLIMATLAEKFVSAQSGKGFNAAMLIMLETTVVSLICYWVVELQFTQNVVLAYPEVILLLILVNYGLGRWTGLRVMEQVRFREVIKHVTEE